MENKEYSFKGTALNGFLMLFVNAVVLIVSLVGIVYSIILLDGSDGAQKILSSHYLEAREVLPGEVFFVDLAGRQCLWKIDFSTHKSIGGISGVDILELQECDAVRAEAPLLEKEGYEQAVKPQEEVVGLHAIPDVVGKLESQLTSHAMCARESSYLINLVFFNHCFS